VDLPNRGLRFLPRTATRVHRAEQTVPRECIIQILWCQVLLFASFGFLDSRHPEGRHRNSDRQVYLKGAVRNQCRLLRFHFPPPWVRMSAA
jgi:hypothetical protein